MLLFLTINNIFVQILYAMSEKELIILLKNGDEKAFTTLYRLYWSKVYNFSRLYLSSITEVEEVVQEVFVKVWETRDFLRADDNFKGYLFIILKSATTRLYDTEAKIICIVSKKGAQCIECHHKDI